SSDLPEEETMRGRSTAAGPMSAIHPMTRPIDCFRYITHASFITENLFRAEPTQSLLQGSTPGPSRPPSAACRFRLAGWAAGRFHAQRLTGIPGVPVPGSPVGGHIPGAHHVTEAGVPIRVADVEIHAIPQLAVD